MDDNLLELVDYFERRALQLENEQRIRYIETGFPSGFADSRYERMQTFLIERYRKKSKTWNQYHSIVRSS